jgi:hypothetical protein
MSRWAWNRPGAFLGLSSEKAFDNVTIATTFFPRVDKQDFKPLARALRLHLLTEHNVCCLEIQSSPFGEVFVGFNSPLERRRFLVATRSRLGSMMKLKMQENMILTRKCGY